MTTKTLISGNPPHFGAVYATDASAGAGDVGKVPLLNAAGTLDSSFFTPGGTLKTLKETVFAGLATQTFTNGVNATLDGLSYSFGISAGGTASIVAAGLQITAPTSNTQEVSVEVIKPAIGNLITQARWSRRGGIGVWVRTSSINWGTATSGFWYGSMLYTAYPVWGIGSQQRLSGANNQQGMFSWHDGTDDGTIWPLFNSPTNNTNDVLLAYFRSPWSCDIYYGTYSGGWPDISSMQLGGSVSSLFTRSISTVMNGGSVANLILHLGGGQASNTSAKIIYDRWRLTVWE